MDMDAFIISFAVLVSFLYLWVSYFHVSRIMIIHQ